MDREINVTTTYLGILLDKVEACAELNEDLISRARSELSEIRRPPKTVEVLGCTPPDYIVGACEQVGLDRPKDVRWVEIGRCSCGEYLPDMRQCEFTATSGQSWQYLIGQCSKCGTIYWKQVIS